jgi:regulator of protease activity HflC (stomatin/prohibitin superfamily)
VVVLLVILPLSRKVVREYQRIVLFRLGRMTGRAHRRAVVTEAEGDRTAAVLRAEGSKQAAILEAEGLREATILAAEGERQAAVLQAEGFAAAITTVYGAVSPVDAKTMAIQYLDALRALGTSDATKIVLPFDLTAMASGIASLARDAFDGRTAEPD